MTWRLLVGAACLLLPLACTAADTDPGADRPGVTAGGSSTTTSLPAGPGRLVVLDDAGNIVTMDGDGSSPSPVSDDAGERRGYAQPLWSPESDRLAWVELSSDGVGLGLSDDDGGNRSLVEMAAPPFYLSWSPDGSALGVLHNGSAGALELEIVDTSAGTTAVVAEGAPLYFSWSPGSDQVAAHVSEDNLIGIRRDGTTVDLGPTASGYAAPSWTGDGIVHLAPAGLSLLAVDGLAETLATVRAPMAMVVNPQGTRLAIQSYAEDTGLSASLSEVPVLPSNQVLVLDRSTGEVSPVADALSVGLFWSPDGERLLVLKPSGPGEMEVLVWERGETTSQFRMVPEPSWVRDVLQFFDQYAQSLRLWSPDSAAFALPGAVGGEGGVWVHVVGADSPTRVSDGTWAAWSN